MTQQICARACKTESSRQHFEIARCYRPLSAQSGPGSFAGAELAGRNPRVAITSVTGRGVYVIGGLPRSSASYLRPHMVHPRSPRGPLTPTKTGGLSIRFWCLPSLYLTFSTVIHHIIHHKEPESTIQNVCIMTISHYPFSTLSRVIIQNPGSGPLGGDQGSYLTSHWGLLIWLDACSDPS
jgi:hypothetical protein